MSTGYLHTSTSITLFIWTPEDYVYVCALSLTVLCAGITDDPAESLFTYKPGESWATFYDPFFTPTYEPVFSDPVLETEANTICGDDQFCLFDIAATGRIEVGLSTLEGSQNYEMIVNLSRPGII